MRIKRILFTLLVALMMFSLVAFASAADSTTSSFEVEAKVEPSVALLGNEGLFELVPGSDIEVTANVVENTGVTRVTLYFYYDADIMEYQEDSYVNGALFANADAHTVTVDEGNGFVLVKYQASSVDSRVTLSGAIGSVKFTIKEDYHGDLTSQQLYIKGSYFDDATIGFDKFDTSVEMRTYKIHNYGEPVVDNPTCVDNGKATYTCSCGDVYAPVIEAVGYHVPGEVVVENNVAPDCYDTGSYDNVTYCTVCETELNRANVIVPELGHNEVAHEAQAPTCTDKGWDAYVTCSRCDYTTYVEKDELGHTEVVDAAVAATCTATGLTAGKHCDVCKEVLVAQTVVEKLPHTEVADAAVAATCTATGLTAGKHCDVCKEVLVAQTVVEKLPHTEVVDAAVAATCTATGLTAGKHCGVCKEVLEAQTVVEKLPHTEVVDAAVAPTCTETGLTAGKHCDVCKEVLEAQTVVDALGHDEVAHEAQAPTCTAIGWDAYVTCSRCDYTTYVEKVALGHDEIAHEAQAPTCTEIGWDAYVTCSRCDYTTYAEKAALGHTEEVLAKVEPTCTTTGLTAGKKCSVCNTVLEAQTEIAALGHSYGEWVETTAPTTKAEGEETKTCSRCQDKQTQPIEMLPAENGWIVAVVIIAAVVVCAGAAVGVVFYKKKKGC